MNIVSSCCLGYQQETHLFYTCGFHPVTVTKRFAGYLELLSEFLLLVLELVHSLLIPAPGLGLQVTGSSRDHTRLLEQGAVQRHRLDTHNTG